MFNFLVGTKGKLLAALAGIAMVFAGLKLSERKGVVKERERAIKEGLKKHIEVIKANEEIEEDNANLPSDAKRDKLRKFIKSNAAKKD